MEDLEVALQVLIDVEDGGDITAAVAVVRGRPDRDQIGVLEPVFESVHDELVRPCNQLQVVDVVELCGHLAAKEPAGASW